MDSKNKVQVTNKKQKKLYKKPWFIILMVIIFSLFGAIGYNLFMGGSDGIFTHKIQSQQNRRIKVADNAISKSTNGKISMPSYETLSKELQNNLHEKSMQKITGNKFDEMTNYIDKKYGKKVTSLFLRGKIVSANMTPSQQQNVEIDIAKSLDKNDFVGFPQKDIRVDIDDGHIISKNYMIDLSNSYYDRSFQNQNGYTKVNNHKISSPVIFNIPSNFYGIKNDEILDKVSKKIGNVSSLIIFVKANDNDDFKSINDFTEKLQVSVNNIDSKTPVQMNNTVTQNQKQFNSLIINDNTMKGNPFSTTKLIQDKNIFPNSIVPVLLSVPNEALTLHDGTPNKNISVKINGTIYKLNYYSDGSPSINLK